MFKIKSEIQFDMAHFLSGYDGKCSNIHGHRYRLIATFRSKEVHQQGHLRGMVDDFSNIKKALKEIEELFDHKLVIEDNEEGQALKVSLRNYNTLLVPYRPTAELMSQAIYHILKEKEFPIYEVELFETPTNSCIYSEDDN